MTNVVDHLKKVSLDIRGNDRKASFEFIVGAASEGLCPFEFELLQKGVGDRLDLSVAKAAAARTFAHLYAPLCSLLEWQAAADSLELSLTIAGVEDPEPREVVRAMAQATEQSGCGGDCGCGCGGH